MKRFLPLLLLIALPALAGPSRRYIVITRQAADQTSMQMLRQSDDLQHAVRKFSIINAFAATLTEGEVTAMQRAPEVISVEPVVERHALDAGPAVTPQSNLAQLSISQTVPYGIDLVHAREVWPFARGENVNVA